METQVIKKEVKKKDRPTVAEKEYWVKRVGEMTNRARYSSPTTDQRTVVITQLGIQKELKAYHQAKAQMKLRADAVKAKVGKSYRSDPDEAVNDKADELFKHGRVQALEQISDAVWSAATHDDLAAAIQRIRDMETKQPVQLND